MRAVKEYFGGSKDTKVLDMGCAGGQMIADFVEGGYTAVGLKVPLMHIKEQVLLIGVSI